MIIMPQVKELQRGDLTTITGGPGCTSLPSGAYRNVCGTFSSVGSDCTSVIALNFNATITNTGTAVTSPYTYSYPSTWSTITTNAYSTVPTVTLNRGSCGTAGGTGGGGGGTAGGGATAGGNGGTGGAGGPGLAGRRWDEQTTGSNNTVYGAAGSGGTGGTGAAGTSSISGANGLPGVSSLSTNLVNKLYGWGNNINCRIGDGTGVSRCNPTLIRGDLNFTCITISPPIGFVYALTTDCKLYTWGATISGVLATGVNANCSTPTNICSSCTFDRVCLIACSAYVFGTDNKLYSVGSNTAGVLGNGNTTDQCFLVNICPSCTFKCIRTEVDNDWSESRSIFAVDTNDKLLVWGCNLCGQLGNGNTTDQCSPVAICSTCTFKCIVNCNSTTAVLDTNNKLFLWGRNDKGQVGNGNTINQCSPVAVCSSCTFKDVLIHNIYSAPSVCLNYVHVLTTDCKLFTWGDNTVGQIGNGNTTSQCLPVAICSACNFLCIYTKNATSFALGTDCKLYAWGCNNIGQLGNGNTINQCTPVAICSSCAFKCIFQFFDGKSTFAIDINDKLYSWGYNVCGMLGDGTITNRCLPTAICSSCFFKCIFTPWNQATVYALDINHRLYGWGYNADGQLGNGTTTSSCLPVSICSSFYFNNKILVTNYGIHAITHGGGNAGRGGCTGTITAPAGGAGGAGGGGGGGGQSIFCRYSYPSYIAQNMDALPTPGNCFHGNGGVGASGNITSATAGGTGSVPATGWPATTSRSGTGGSAGAASPTANATAGGNGGCVTIAGPNANAYPGSGTAGDLGTPSDTFTFSGAGTAGSNSAAGSNGTGPNAGSTGTTGGVGGTGTSPSAGGGGGGRGGAGGSGLIQATGANGGDGGAGSSGGAGGGAGKTLGLMVYNYARGSIFTYGASGSVASPGTPGATGQSCTHPNGTVYSGACGGAGGIGGSGGSGSAGRILLVGRCPVFCNTQNIIRVTDCGQLYMTNSSCTITNICSSTFKLVQSQDINGTYFFLDENGKLYSCGANNSAGILGVGDTTCRSTLTAVCSSLCFKCVCAHEYCAKVGFAIDCNNKLYGWGSNSLGQLGTGDTVDKCSPYNICSSCTFCCMVTTAYSSYFLTTDGKLFSVGYNTFAELGNGNTTNQCTLNAICPSCSFSQIIPNGIYNYSGTIYVLGTDCKLYAWGHNDYGLIGNGNTTYQCSPVAICPSCTFMCVSPGVYSTYALTTDCKLFAWGLNDAGQLGNGNIIDQCVPVAICSSCTFNQLKAVCFSVYAITTTNKLLAWGCNVCGQVGNGGTVNQCFPVAICCACDFSTIKKAGNSVFALTTDNKLFAWGSNNCGQIGNGNITAQCTPYAVCPNLSFCCVAVDNTTVLSLSRSIYAITTNGKLYTWGNNNFGQLGNGNTTTQCRPINILSNVQFTGATNINNYDFIASGCPICTFTVNGIIKGEDGVNGSGEKLYTWGCNTVGQLGNGNITAQCSPVAICSTIDFNLCNSVNNSNHVLILDSTDKLYSWGCNNSGQIGNGNTTNQCLPVAICSSCTFRCAIAFCRTLAGTATVVNSSIAIGTDGKLYVWGSNNSGQIGDGTTVNRCAPFNVCSSLTFNCVTTLGCSMYTLTTDCKLYAWGCNASGQLGIGNTFDQYEPSIICSSCNFKDIYLSIPETVATSDTSVYAIGTDCKLYSWGGNTVGELGNGNKTAQCSPVAICSACTFMCLVINPNYKSVFALTTDCKLFSWGCNVNNQLGNGDALAADVCSPTALCSTCTFMCVITGGSGTTYAITTTCKLFGWGSNNFGQVGNGLACTSNQTTPAAICSTCNFSQVITDGCSAYALTTDCLLFTWGRNVEGNLGNGNTTAQCLPVAICSTCNFDCIFIRNLSVYARGVDGKLYAWGSNNCGQLGNGNITNQCSPVAICSSLYFTCVLPMTCGCGAMAIASSNIGTGGVGGTWAAFATLTCGTAGTQGVRGIGGAGGTITSPTAGESSVYYLT